MVLMSKGYLFSSSSIWILLLFVVNVMPRYLGDTLLYFAGPASSEVMDRISVYSLVVLISFIVCNYIALHMKPKTLLKTNEQTKQSSKLESSHLLLAWGIYLLMLLVFLVYLSRTTPISTFFNNGSKILFDQEENIAMLLFPTLLLGLNMISLLALLYAKNKKQLFISLTILSASITVTLLFSFGRRMLIFPFAVALILYYLKDRSKRKLVLIFLSVLLTLTVIMPFMMFVRTFGVANALEKYLPMIQKYDVAMLASQTDFTMAYNLLVLQVQVGDVRVDPLTILKPLFMVIPRSIWPEKPVALCIQILPQLGINIPGYSAAPGFIGESLALLGLLGIVFFPALWGVVCGRYDRVIRSKYLQNKRVENVDIRVIAYLLFAVQLVTGMHRGDTGNAMVEFILIIIPLLMILRMSAFALKKRQPVCGSPAIKMVNSRRREMLAFSVVFMVMGIAAIIISVMLL